MHPQKPWVRNFFALIISIFIFNLFLLISFTSTSLKTYAQTSSFQATDDVFVAQTMPNNNQHFRDHLGSGYGYYNGSFGKTPSLIQFNNFSLNQSTLVASAKLRFKQYTTTMVGRGNWQVYASKIDNNWNSAAVNWNNKPGFSQNSGSQSINESYSEFEVDVTEIIKNWQQGTPNYGIALRSDNNSQGGWICSVREDKNNNNGGSETRCPGYGPQLIVNYSDNKAPLEPVLVSPNNGSKFGGEPYNNCTKDLGCNVYFKNLFNIPTS